MSAAVNQGQLPDYSLSEAEKPSRSGGPRALRLNPRERAILAAMARCRVCGRREMEYLGAWADGPELCAACGEVAAKILNDLPLLSQGILSRLMREVMCRAALRGEGASQ